MILLRSMLSRMMLLLSGESEVCMLLMVLYEIMVVMLEKSSVGIILICVFLFFMMSVVEFGDLSLF